MSDRPIVSRRHFLENLFYPILAGFVGGSLGGIVTASWSNRYKDRHDISVSIAKSGNANLEDTFVPDNPLVPLTGEVIPATPDPNGFYTYSAFIRNNGQFPEEEVIFSVIADRGDLQTDYGDC